MFNRRLLIDLGAAEQTYSALDVIVFTPEYDRIRLARVELTYNGESHVYITDNKGFAVFYNVPTETELSYKVTAEGYNAATGTWDIAKEVIYDTEYVVLVPLVN